MCFWIEIFYGLRRIATFFSKAKETIGLELWALKRVLKDEKTLEDVFLLYKREWSGSALFQYFSD